MVTNYDKDLITCEGKIEDILHKLIDKHNLVIKSIEVINVNSISNKQNIKIKIKT